MSYDELHEEGSVPIKSWTQGVAFEDQAKEQLRATAKLPIVWPHVAVMPDVHLGIGATVGSVIPTRGAIIPAAVGVDIGCGMCAVRTNLKADETLTKSRELYLELCRSVPHGSSKGHGDVGAWSGPLPANVQTTWEGMADAYDKLVESFPKIHAKQAASQMGTLGGGNHFVEMCLDEEDHVWLMLHSGSRGAGNKIGQHFIERAKELAVKNGWELPHVDLAYLPEEHPDFLGYTQALMWAQDYAMFNRRMMMVNSIAAVERVMGHPFDPRLMAVNCHHNYVSIEKHFNVNLYITRKGAVSAQLGELGIIPGSMGTKSFIVRGKGNFDSFNSCSHGAGRVMSRGQAKKTITIEDHIRDTAGVECGKDSRVLDESPRAYKRIETVMAAQSDLVEVVHTLKQFLCVKG